MQNYGMNLFFATAWLVLLVIVFAPETVGHWLAQKDIAYDTIWVEWVGDCDCTEPLE